MPTRSIKREDFPGLKVTVMGLGLNGGGLAVARFLAGEGAIVTVTDTRDEKALAPSIARLSGFPVRFVLGRHDMEDFSGADLVIKNPAVRPDSPYLAVARAVETDLSLFLRFSPAILVAVTGSKGKSTTSSAIAHILGSSGRKAFLGGNITVSPLGFLPELDATSFVVLELSSWQLGDLRGSGLLKPRVAVLTKIVPDHLDRYGTMESYVADKRLIYADQDGSSFTVCESYDPWGIEFARETRGTVLWYGNALPEGGQGGFLRGSTGYWRGPDGVEETVVPEKLLVPGAHARRNLLAAAVAASALGVEAGKIAAATASFAGIEHRMEPFRAERGVTWYNDSAATVPEATAAALGSFDCPLVLITGGTDKALDFSPVRDSYRKASAIVLLAGTGTEKLRALLDEDGIRYEGPFEDFTEAIDRARSLAKPGSVIILSPGCTSFGMFRNEFDRGDTFKRIVLERFGG